MGGLAFLAPDKLRPYLWYRGGGYTGSVTIRPSVYVCYKLLVLRQNGWSYGYADNLRERSILMTCELHEVQRVCHVH